MAITSDTMILEGLEGKSDILVVKHGIVHRVANVDDHRKSTKGPGTTREVPMLKSGRQGVQTARLEYSETKSTNDVDHTLKTMILQSSKSVQHSASLALDTREDDSSDDKKEYTNN